jgi:hypothetical protein
MIVVSSVSNNKWYDNTICRQLHLPPHAVCEFCDPIPFRPPFRFESRKVFFGNACRRHMASLFIRLYRQTIMVPIYYAIVHLKKNVNCSTQMFTYYIVAVDKNMRSYSTPCAFMLITE